MDEINKIPPVTRTLIGATLGVTLPTLLKLVHPYVYLLWWPAVTQKLQVWRVITCFFLGSGDLQLLFDVFLLYRNASDLEVNTFFRRTSEMVWALLTMAVVILATNYPLSSPVLFSPMLSALTYIWSRANPHAVVSIFGLISCPALYLPYAYLALDLLIGGEARMLQSSTGVIAGHAYWYLHHLLPASNGGRRLLPTAPAWLRRCLPDSVDPAAPPAPQAAQGGSARSTSYGGTAFAPRGRSFGDTPPGATPPAAGGRALGSASSASTGSSAGLLGWLPSFGRGGGSTASGSAGAARAAGPDREALLRAAEARLQAQRQGSIAGRNSAAARAAAQAASSPSAQARLARATAEAPSAPAGSATLHNESATSALAAKTNTTIRRGAAATGSFAQLAGKLEKQDQQESASGSGGRVAEQRRPDQAEPDAPAQKEKLSDEGGHAWGGGQRLGG